MIQALIQALVKALAALAVGEMPDSLNGEQFARRLVLVLLRLLTVILLYLLLRDLLSNELTGALQAAGVLWAVAGSLK